MHWLHQINFDQHFVAVNKCTWFYKHLTALQMDTYTISHVYPLQRSNLMVWFSADSRRINPSDVLCHLVNCVVYIASDWQNDVYHHSESKQLWNDRSTLNKQTNKIMVMLLITSSTVYFVKHNTSCLLCSRLHCLCIQQIRNNQVRPNICQFTLKS